MGRLADPSALAALIAITAHPAPAPLLMLPAPTAWHLRKR
jgi:hypothetical protein